MIFVISVHYCSFTNILEINFTKIYIERKLFITTRNKNKNYHLLKVETNQTYNYNKNKPIIFFFFAHYSFEFGECSLFVKVGN